jgi:hypothetical protein
LCLLILCSLGHTRKLLNAARAELGSTQTIPDIPESEQKKFEAYTYDHTLSTTGIRKRMSARVLPV